MSADDELENLDRARPTRTDSAGSEQTPKPILWVGLTETGRSLADDDHLDKLGDRIQRAVGDDYHVVAADDTVRLADPEDIDELRAEIARLRHQLPDWDDDQYSESGFMSQESDTEGSS
jgi:hypothetical protein